MSVHLYLSPAASGKTTVLVAQARELAANLAERPRVVVPTRLQVRTWQRSLAKAGGTLGVRVGTFDTLYREILRAAGLVHVLLTNPIQYRLLRTLVAEAPLTYYAPLRTRPGFILVLQDLIRELKAGGVHPDDLSVAVEALGGEPRLLELAQLYTVYQQRLQQEDWSDPAGLGWLAGEALARQPNVGRGWSRVFVDGFDDLTSVQIEMLERLAGRVGELVITLTGVPDGDARHLVHRRFHRTRRRLEKALGVKAEPLPAVPDLPPRAAALKHLESSLFVADAPRQPAAGAVALIAAPDRESEVRNALRWLKASIVRDHLRLGDVALLARDAEPYRPFIRQTAAEFGIPIHILGGLPLRSNPAVAALIDLLRLVLPGDDAFHWRLTVEAWRCPYFDWRALSASGVTLPIDITPDTADVLDRVARWGRIVAGLDQWEEAFTLLAESGPREPLDEEAQEVPATLPTGLDALALRDTFHRFVERVTPPESAHPCRDFVAWIEGLMGGDRPEEEETPSTDLGIVRTILSGPPELQERDLMALNALKDILRGLVWAEEAIACTPVDFGTFFADLVGAVDANVYRLPLPADREAVLVADVTQARGVPFRAVAVLGLAEGEFPAALAEDPFLRNADRKRLRDGFGLSLSPSPDSSEAEYFYEAVTRPRECLLLTRPRIADNGAQWQASPYWEEVRRRVNVQPRRLTSSSYPNPDKAASWEELLLGASAPPADPAVWRWVTQKQPARCSALDTATAVLAQRTRAVVPDRHEGDLTAAEATFARRFRARRAWSASRLEAYRSCPFRFFVGSVLRLEPRPTPAEGLDVAQLGNLYHRILEQLYQAVADPTDLSQLLAALPKVAGSILDKAPRREQFRVTAWWPQTREEIVRNVERSLEALDALRDDFVPYAYEAAFGIPGRPGPVLEVHDGADSFCLRGLIDRVDRAPDGRLRIIDYKSGGPSPYTPTNVKKGKKLQLPLYALAAQDALELGEVADGFYWHVRHAKPSSLKLAKFKVKEEKLHGPQGAIHKVIEHAWDVVRSARRGHFVPAAPEDGCPGFCPAAAICWQYAPRQW